MRGSPLVNYILPFSWLDNKHNRENEFFEPGPTIFLQISFWEFKIIAVSLPENHIRPSIVTVREEDCTYYMRSVTDLGVEHDLRRAVPPRGHVLRQRARVVELGVGDAGEAKVADSDGRRNKR